MNSMWKDEFAVVQELMCAGKRPIPFKTEPAPKQRITGKKIIFMLDHECQEYARSRMRVAKYVTCHVVSR